MYNIRGYKRRIRKRGLKVIVMIVLLCVVCVFCVCSMIGICFVVGLVLGVVGGSYSFFGGVVFK